MRQIFCFGLLFLAGCATHSHDKFNTDDEAEEDRKFFYGDWWHAPRTPDDAEDHAFFYGGSPRR